MAKPNRKSIECWYDLYSDMSLEDQAAALKILEQVHRLAKREKQPKTENGQDTLKLQEPAQ